LKESVPAVAFVLVVDNASGDDSALRLSEILPDIPLIVEKTNRGFSGGCNVGIREALRRGAEQVLLLNGDATMSATALAQMVRVLHNDEQLGIVGPVVVSKTPPGRVESFGIHYSSSTARMWNYDFGSSLSAITRVDRRDVDAVSGCAMLVKRAVFERIGLFDEDYFFGFEDLDFCLRARDSGFLSAAVGTAIVQHEGHASIGRSSSRRIYFGTRNHLLLAHRRSVNRSWVVRGFETLSILGLNLGHALRSSDISMLDGLRGFVAGARHHFAGRYGNPQP
jgi:GT2 family glycosyltransferase